MGDTQMYGFVQFMRKALSEDPEQLTHLIESARWALAAAADREDRRVHADTVTLQLFTHREPPDDLRGDLDEAGIEVCLPPEEPTAVSPIATLVAVGMTSPR